MADAKKLHCYNGKSGKYITTYPSCTFCAIETRLDRHTLVTKAEREEIHSGYIWSFKRYDNIKDKSTLHKEVKTNLVIKQEELEQAVEIKNRILQNKNKSLVKDIAKKELSYIRTIAELETRLEVYEGLQTKPIEYKIESKLDNPKEATAIGVFSDGHVEERVDTRVVNGLNEYNPDIAVSRINSFFRNFVFLIKREQKHFIIQDVVLYVTGDNISGYIHEELRENNYLSPLEAISLVRDTLFNGLKYIVDNCNVKTLYVVCKFGNHARLTQRKSFSTGYKNNLDYFCYKNLEQMFNAISGYENIKFIIEDSELTYFNIYEYVTRCGHGDHFKYVGGIGGLVIPLMRKLKDWDSIKKADMTIFGHWHTWIPGNEFLINGSVIGITPFGLNFAKAGDLIPKQTFMLCVKNRGFTTRTPIFLD